MKEQLVIIGASGHGKVVADIASYYYNDIIFLDDNDTIHECGAYPIVGTSKEKENYINQADFIIAIGNAAIRERLQVELEKAGANMATLIHPSAIIAKTASVGCGTVLAAGAIVNPYARIGRGCIINTGSSVDHDCKVADFVHISVGSRLAGTVEIGERTWIGIGAVVSNNLTVTSDCMIGAGAVVVHNIEESGTYVGVPARKIK